MDDREISEINEGSHQRLSELPPPPQRLTPETKELSWLAHVGLVAVMEYVAFLALFGWLLLLGYPTRRDVAPVWIVLTVAMSVLTLFWLGHMLRRTGGLGRQVFFLLLGALPPVGIYILFWWLPKILWRATSRNVYWDDPTGVRSSTMSMFNSPANWFRFRTPRHPPAR